MNEAPLRILVIDDDVVDRVTVRRLLANDGSVTVAAEAADTATAESLLARGGIDAVLCDHHLPGEDGLSFLARFATHPDTPPVIALTGQGDEVLATAMLKAGAADYLGKDRLTAPRLAATIRHAVTARLDRQRAARTDAILRRLERGISGCARALLLDAHPPRTLATALRHLAESAEVHRAVLFLNREEDDGALVHVVVTEALRDAPSLLDRPVRHWRPGLLRWQNDLAAGEQVSGELRHLPLSEQTALAEDGIQAVLAIPFSIRHRWAGLVRFDRLTPTAFHRDESRMLRAAVDLISVYAERSDIASPSLPTPR